MFFVLYIGLFVFVNSCESRGFEYNHVDYHFSKDVIPTTSFPKVKPTSPTSFPKVKPTSPTSFTEVKPTSPAVDTTSGILIAIKIEERKIKILRVEIANAVKQYETVEIDCNKTIEGLPNFNNLQKNYSKALLKQHKVLINRENLLILLNKTRTLLNKTNIVIEKERFRNLLLVNDVNLLMKRRNLGYNVKCQKYINYRDNFSLSERSFAGLQLRPKTRIAQLLHRLYRVKNISHDLSEELAYNKKHLKLAQKFCADKIEIITSPMNEMKQTFKQLLLNTKKIVLLTARHSYELKEYKKAVLERKSYLKKLMKYNKILLVDFSKYAKDKKCYEKLERL